ncbi:MAG: penicillin-binding protein 2 [Bdellovibrionales bacterium]|nr:penicillin-binding protein 2 [Bdellovibrionales bacterium]
MGSRHKSLLHFDFASTPAVLCGKALDARSRALRLRFVFTLILLWIGLIVVRLYVLQIADVSKWQSSALRQHLTTLELSSERGPIRDREGRLLAVSVPSGSVYLRPKLVSNRDEARKLLAEVLSLSNAEIEEKLNSESPFVWVKRQIPKVVAEQIEQASLEGIGYLVEPRRFYPFNAAASTLIGKVGIDGNGLTGLEAAFDRGLHEHSAKTKVIRDALGQTLEHPSMLQSEFELPKGQALDLTLDAHLQLIVDEELERGRIEAKAEQGLAVLVNARTGEILSLSQAPEVNFNSQHITEKSQFVNRVLESAYEPGSVFKPIVMALALENRVVSPNQQINCESGRFRFGKHTINDVHGSDVLTAHDVIVKSSNIGMTKIGMQLGAERIYQGLRDFGFGEVSLGLFPAEASGILRPVNSWAQVDVATHSFGQGVSVTPLQMVRAISAIANGGFLPQLAVVKQTGMPVDARQILSQRTANDVRDMMISVVEQKGGTGSRAHIDGLTVGGKTGTAQRARDDGRGYEPHSYISSFIGFVAADSSRVRDPLVLLVTYDRPRGESYYGGLVAAPVFRRVMERSVRYLDQYSSHPEKTVPSFRERIPELTTEQPFTVQRVALTN